MQYTFDEALQETLRRAGALKKRRFKAQTRALSAAIVVLLGSVLAIGAGYMTPQSPVIGDLDYGAFLLPSEAGGYILAAVAAFVIGVLVTLLCIHLRGAEPQRGRTEREQDGTDAVRPAAAEAHGGIRRSAVIPNEQEHENKHDVEGESK